jgi:CRP/FNR family transcriptional regulator
MFTVRHTEKFDPVRHIEADGDAGTTLQNVATGDVLFQPGDQRRTYRVEEGAICHYIRWADGSHDMIQVAFPGDIVGLGYLATHVSTAQAMVPTVVSLVSEAELAHERETDDRLEFLMASAGEREFDYMRDATTRSGERSPVGRVASYLVAVAHLNKTQGQAHVVADDVSTGYVADQLKISVDVLQTALVSLENKGLVASSGSGLEILDLGELERLSNAA